MTIIIDFGFLIFLGIAILWYAIGLFGSDLVTASSSYTTWKNSKVFCIVFAFLGPINLIVGLIFFLGRDRSKDHNHY